jgi:DNA polymerase-3 subunit delta'
MGLRHPDLHWLVPIPRPKAGEPEKQIEEAAESLGAVMEERRAAPLWTRPDGMAIHGVASVRLLQRAAALTSVEGGMRVFVIGDAERLVPQESSPEAANAVLKLLEEPPGRSLFILTAVDARRLLPTIRSRAVQLRLGRLPDAEVRSFLRDDAGIAAADVDEKVRQADGAIGSVAGEEGGSKGARRSAELVIEAALAGRGPMMQRALAQGPFAARGEFSALLDAMEELLSDASRASLGGSARGPVPRELAGRDAAALVRAAELVGAAREAAQGNVNPQLLLAVLGEELAEVL